MFYKKLPIKTALTALLSALLLMAHSSAAAFDGRTEFTESQPRVPDYQPRVPQSRTWNLRDVDVRAVIEEIARETGKNFIIDPRVQGKVSIVSGKAMSANEIYQVFLSTLQVLGYAAIPSGQVVKIIPTNDARGQVKTIANGAHPGVGDEIVVRVIPVFNVKVAQLMAIVRPLLPDWASVSTYDPTNVLIIAGSAENVSRIAKIIHRVDTTNSAGIDVVPLHYVEAEDLAETMTQLQQTAERSGNHSEITIAADSQSNTLLISGNQAERLKMHVLISQLDTPSANGASGNTQVVYLHYLRAKDIVPILAGVAQSYYRGAVGTVIGSKSPIGETYDPVQNGAPSSGEGGGDMNADNAAPMPEANNGNSQAETKTVQTAEGKSHKPRIEIIAEPNTNSVILNAPPALMQTLRSVIRKLDIRPAEVLIEALVAEVDRDSVGRLGIDWGSVTQAAAASAVDLASGFRSGIGIINGKGIHNLQGVIKALAEDKNSDILSTPAVVVLDNHQAQVVVGKEVSIQTSSQPGNAGGGTSATPFNTFGREKVALHLYVTPQIDHDNNLLLSIDQGNDNLENPEDDTTTPVINISGIKTSVMVKTGDIIVLGGLIENQITRGNQRIPILGDIPIIGNVFKVNRHTQQKKNLMVFIRPIIIEHRPTYLNVTGQKYNLVRNQQLNLLNSTSHEDALYSHGPLHPYLLPKWGPDPHIPTPFIGNAPEAKVTHGNTDNSHKAW